MYDDASFVGPGSTRRLLRRLLTKPLVPRVLALWVTIPIARGTYAGGLDDGASQPCQPLRPCARHVVVDARFHSTGPRARAMLHRSSARRAGAHHRRERGRRPSAHARVPRDRCNAGHPRRLLTVYPSAQLRGLDRCTGAGWIPGPTRAFITHTYDPPWAVSLREAPNNLHRQGSQLFDPSKKGSKTSAQRSWRRKRRP